MELTKGTPVWVDWAGGVKRGRVDGPRHGGGYYVMLEDGSPIGAPAYYVFVRESDAWRSVIEGLRRQRHQLDVRLSQAEGIRAAVVRREQGISGEDAR